MLRTGRSTSTASAELMQVNSSPRGPVESGRAPSDQLSLGVEYAVCAQCAAMSRSIPVITERYSLRYKTAFQEFGKALQARFARSRWHRSKAPSCRGPSAGQLTEGYELRRRGRAFAQMQACSITRLLHGAGSVPDIDWRHHRDPLPVPGRGHSRAARCRIRRLPIVPDGGLRRQCQFARRRRQCAPGGCRWTAGAEVLMAMRAKQQG